MARVRAPLLKLAIGFITPTILASDRGYVR